MDTADTRRLDEALARVQHEERALDALTADYDVVRSSKLYGLHLLLEGLTRPAAPPEQPQPAPIDVFDEEAFERLALAWRARTESRPLCANPVVSIVIPVYNHCAVTVRCLQSIADTWFDSLEVQIVLVDDGSTDETQRLETALAGLDYVRNQRNAGFIASCNRGAQIARGRYICFLNNDTEVRNAWLDELVATAERDGSIGAVGSKLLFPDGTLQEAGGIIFREGDGANYGRGGDPADPRYNYVRDVDYCSGAALLVRTELFRSLGGFDRRYSPAYYEDADLCFAVRAAGYRVVYQPRSCVVHYEGATSGTDLSAGAKRHQQLNRPKFVKKWRKMLAAHVPNAGSAQAAGARRIRSGQTLLVVDSYVPLHDREAGSKRLFEILRIVRDAGFHVIFLPDNYAPLQPYASQLEAMGIEVLYHVHGGRTQQEALEEILPMLDFAWICRPELFEKYGAAVRRNASTRLIYDTIDLHFLRQRREFELLGIGEAKQWQNMQALELAAARDADATITVTEDERAVLRDLGVENVHVVPTLHEAQEHQKRACAKRKGLLFIGSYDHTPNVDAVVWLCTHVMPLVWKRLPNLPLTLLGNNPSGAVRELEGPNVRVPGYVADVVPYFEEHRVFVAPLRFGAGHKGKVGQSLSFGLPIVMTQVAAEGFDLVPERDYLAAETAQEFADAIVRLYADSALWQTLSENGLRAIEPFSRASVAPRIQTLLRELTAAAGAAS